MLMKLAPGAYLNNFLLFLLDCTINDESSSLCLLLGNLKYEKVKIVIFKTT